MFTSRSFSSRATAPQDSKYWAAYKTNAQGQRQTVLLDMSHVPAEDLDFPVLFPMQDIANHSNDAHVDWAFDAGRFGITVNDTIEAGAEVFNNYGPKTNDELLLGYGFCIPNNPYDGVLLTLKAPPKDLQQELRQVHPGYFTRSGYWAGERATFRLGRPSPLQQQADQIFHTLPEPLLELLLYILRHERGLPFVFTKHPLDHLTNDRRYLPHIARMIVQSLAPKLQALHPVDLPDEPANNKQRQALICRTAQLEIMQATISALRTFTRSLLKTPDEGGPRFVTLEGLLEFWSSRTSAQTVLPFVRGIEAVSGTADVDRLREAGWEDDVVVLLLCYMCIEATAEEQLASIDEGGEGGGAEVERKWVDEWLPSYIQSSSPDPDKQDTDARARAASLLELVESAAEQVDGGVWRDARWSVDLIAEVGGKMVQYESITMMVPRPDGRGDEARMVVYLHGSQDRE